MKSNNVYALECFPFILTCIHSSQENVNAAHYSNLFKLTIHKSVTLINTLFVCSHPWLYAEKILVLLETKWDKMAYEVQKQTISSAKVAELE